MERIRPLARKKTPPQPDDWMAMHQEAGQSYEQFRHNVTSPAIQRFSTLRLVPIGPLSDGQSRVLQVVRDLLQPFFGLAIVEDPAVPLDSIPEDAQRLFLPFDPPQLLTSYLLNQVLMTRRQSKDAAVLGITASDLWPGAGWNYVFGQASLRERVGVWSMARNGDADGDDDSQRLCAFRTAKTAIHETGHMFGIRHCIAYECGMNGSNHAEERDRQPLEFCPECQAKLWWTLELDPANRARSLEAAARKHGYPQTADDFAKHAALLDSRR